jgi:chemotaxis protein histidine kinase CheA
MSEFSLDDLVLEYLAESREHLATIETDLLAIEQAGAAIDEQLVNRVFRAAHSINGGAGFFDLLQNQGACPPDGECSRPHAFRPNDPELRDRQHPSDGI